MNIQKIITISLITASSLYPAAYKLTTSSLNSNSLSSAYVAAANGADSSYYNPANMVFNENKHHTEYVLAYINVPQTKFEHATMSLLDAKTTEEKVFIPGFHFASKDIDGIRYGFSLISPAGLTRRWTAPLQKATAEEFSAKMIELNPTIAYKVNPKFSIGGGIRALYSEAVVKSDSAELNAINPLVPSAARDMEGDDISYGYNLALSYRPTPLISLASTYRSNIKINFEGDAKLYASGVNFYDGSGSVSIPLPAVFTLALAYKLQEKTTLEVLYERTYWSKYDELDFKYETPQPTAFELTPKNFEDTNAYRVGLTHQYSEKLKLMIAYAQDKSPIPETTLGFELPGSDAKMGSTGFEYKIDDQKSFGMSYLYNKKEDRTVLNSGVQGKFSDIKAHVLTVGYKVNF